MLSGIKIRHDQCQALAVSGENLWVIFKLPRPSGIDCEKARVAGKERTSGLKPRCYWDIYGTGKPVP